ncbi:hypothetical protein Pint_10077 [Pistacia integerrima]|uniref:Uncharacterized protein n=1 Tax=Pistacia integerrima TaxID=434235 RepID=A0ACC0XEP5_9ROSI|nr:hypothetical protein Pint_10077 [Pistacia integerrima]
MATQISNFEPDSWSMEPNSPVGFDEHRLEQVIAEGSLDFDEWTLLLSEIENTFHDDIEKICLVYDAFLAEFPLCYGYWLKYADHKARLCTAEKVVEVFERAVQAATYSVDVWLQYCCLSVSAFEDPHNVRRLFKRALSFVGKDYLCHTLWDKYLEFEFSQQRWSSLAHIYIQTLRFPSKRLHNYYDRYISTRLLINVLFSFKKLAAAWKEKFDCRNSATELQSDLVLESGVPKYFRDDEISAVIKELLEPSVGLARSKAVQKYVLIGEHIYKEACQLDEKIHCFETRIRRPYFHVKPLDGDQLENWHDYLNFAEKQGDFDWVVKLYERCLIPCANYAEFWMRYVDFMETKGGREIANLALARATQIFLKRMPMVHLFSAQYKEQIGDVCAARAAFLGCDTETDSTFVENVTIKANMEKRLGNFLAACNVFKEALETAAEKKKLHILPILYVRFSRLQYMTTDSADAARDILIDGIKHVPHCKLLLEELIKFVMMHGGSRHLNVVDSVIANAVYSGPDVLDAFSLKDVEDVSSLYLQQFVDLCGTIHDVRKAWNRHIKLFPHSVRTAYEHPAAGTKPLKSFMERRLKSIVALTPRPSGSDHSLQSPSQDKKLSPPENYDSQSDHDATAPLSEQKSPLLENHDIQSDAGARIDHLHSGEAENSVQEKMQQVSPEVREQHREDICEPIVASLDLVHEFAAETETKASLEFSKDASDHESKEDMKPLSVERLSLYHQENQSPSSVCATSHECEAPQETSLSHESNLKSEALQENSMSNGDMLLGDQNNNGSQLLSSSMSTQVSDSSQIQTETFSPSSVACHQNFVKEEHLQPQKPMNSERNWRQKHNNDRIHRDSRFGFRGHSHKKQHQQRRVSPQRYPRAEPHAQMPMNRGYHSQPLPSQNPQFEQGSQAQSDYPASANLTAPQAWPIQNMQQQNFASASQVPAQPVAYAEAQMSQFPTQSHEQQGHLQGNQGYNQMWQYYYYQQQQQQQQQQFLLQQQHLQQLHQQQPHQQQQYQAQQYFQQQQQLPHVQQQLQIQQPHFLQQQPYQQQHLPYLQPQQQMQYQQVQQQQQQQPQPHQQQQEQEQRQPEHQNTVLQINTRSQNSSEQGIGVAPPYSTGVSGTVTSAASPNPQHQSPQSL